MKKVIALVLSLTLVVVSLIIPSQVLSAFAAGKYPGPLTVVKATIVPTIDGKISSNEWSSSEKHVISTAATINTGIGDAWAPETSKAVADMYFLWNEKGLYFAADVADDTLAPSLAEGVALNTTDGIQLGFNPGRKASDALSGGYYFSFVPGSNSDVKGAALSYEHFVYGNGAGANVADKGVIVKGIRNATNYKMEGFIPWSVINSKGEGFTPAVGKDIPFGICLMDYSADSKVLSLTKSFLGWGTVGFKALTLAPASRNTDKFPGPVTVTKAATAPTIDGKISSNEWSASDKNIISTAATIKTGIGDAWAPETSKAVANMYFLWDDKGLYFAADVTDDTIAPSLAEGVALNATDGLQLGFDPARKASDALNGGYFFSFVSGSNADVKGPALSYEHFVYGNGAGANVADKGVIVKGIRNATNYKMEGFIPWSVINAKGENFTPAIGKDIPFGICLMDYSADSKVLSLTKSFLGWGTVGFKALTLAPVNTSDSSESPSSKASSDVKSIKLNNSKITLKVGQISNLKVTFTPANTTQKKLTYVTGNKKIATVDATGKITAVSAGTTTITVYTLNKKIFAKCNVTIKSK